MSETTGTAVRRLRDSSPLIDEVRRALEQRADGAKARAVLDFASIFLASGREAWHLANLLQEPIYLLSGFYFPVKAMGFWVATFASIIPLTVGLDAMRQLLFVTDATLGFLSVEVEIGILVVLTVVFIGGAYYMLSKLEEIGRREGRLTERRR